jgi:transposase-like protein
MSKSPYTPEFRAKVALEYIDGSGSLLSIANYYGIDDKTVSEWVAKYKLHGINAFISCNGNASYSSEFKIQCVEDYLSGEGSLNDIISKYNISSSSVLRNWIKSYNANRELKDYCPNREVYMAEARRKTTIEERKEIVDYCIKNNRNYKETASVYSVSYSQVYSWVRKYDEKGDDGLIDKRGHHKTDDELSELELLRRENIRLKKKLEEQERIALLLKKVQEFERM